MGRRLCKYALLSGKKIQYCEDSSASPKLPIFNIFLIKIQISDFVKINKLIQKFIGNVKSLKCPRQWKKIQIFERLNYQIPRSILKLKLLKQHSISTIINKYSTESSK